MNSSFLMLLAAAVIFRYLGSHSKSVFRGRLTRLLRREVTGNRLHTVLREHPERLPEFRSHILPMLTLQLFCDAAACSAIVLGVYAFPPENFGPNDLFLVRLTSTLVFALALLFDAYQFVRAVLAAFGRSVAGGSEE